MARFNFDPVPTVAPTGAPANDYEHIPTSPAMFGGAIAGAEEKLGQGVESVGNAGLDYLKAKQGLTNEISASETNTWLAKSITDKFNTFGQLQGKAAQDQLPQFKQDIEDLYQQSLKNAGGNLQMQAMLAKSGRFLTDAYYRYGTNHADQQWRSWQGKTFDDRASEFGNQAAVAAQHGTWDEVDAFLDTSDDEVRKKLEAQHLDADSISAEVAKRRGTNVKNIVDTLSNTGDPRTAQAIFDKYRDKMDAGGVLAVSSHLKGLNAQLDGHTVADEETGRVPRAGPVGDAIERAAKATGLDPALLHRFAGIESSGNPRAVTGSYKGLFQLSDAEFEKYGGGDIFSPRDNAMAAAKKLQAESQGFEARYGRPPTGADLYMIHQQGAAGYAAHMEHPDAPAWQNMLATGEGKQKGEAWAKQAIWGNVPDQDKARFGSVDKVTSRAFLDLWQARYGREAAGGLPEKAAVYDRILARTADNPLAQNAAVARMNQIFSIDRAEQTQARVLFDQRMKDEKAESFDTGSLSTKTPLTENDFVQRYGLAEGREKFQEHADDIDLGAKMAAAAGMTPEERNALIPQPQPGAGYARAVARRTQFDTAMHSLDRDRKEDPAGLALKRLPDVRAAYQGMAQVEGDKNSTPDQVKAARANFAATMRAEQTRIGIDPQEQRLMPKAAVDALNARFATAADSEDPQARAALVAGVHREASLWGDENWPQVMRQLAPESRPLVRAIAAGADPEAMGRLLRLDKTDTPAAILKEQNETTPKKVQDAVNDAMVPYQRSLMPVQRDKEGKGYSGLAEKLAALHVRDDGDSPDVAAGKAFNELVGNRFAFKDTWRMPKSAGVSPDDVQAGTVAARASLAELGAKPPIDQPPGRRPNEIAQDLTLVARNGTWITAHDNSGLNMLYRFVDADGLYKERFVTNSAGKPLVVPWAELARRGQAWTQADDDARRMAGSAVQ